VAARPGTGVMGAEEYRFPIVFEATPRFGARKLLDRVIQVEGEVKFIDRDRRGRLCGSSSAA
jgi:hypothetical protein